MSKFCSENHLATTECLFSSRMNLALLYNKHVFKLVKTADKLLEGSFQLLVC